MLAGFDNNAPKVGFGWCVRGSSGKFVLAHVSSFGGFLKPAEGEALGLLRAIQWVTTLQLDHVIFETDCKAVVDRLNQYPNLITQNWASF